MMAYGGMVRDQVQVHSISKTEICFKDYGGMMSYTARFVPFFKVVFIDIIVKAYDSCFIWSIYKFGKCSIVMI